MNEAMTTLKPANQNQWYVLLTLYGEVVRLDLGLNAMNRNVWNAWACQGMGEQQKQQLSLQGFNFPRKTLWQDEGDSIQALHRAEMVRRNPVGFEYPGFPEPSTHIDMSRLDFDHDIFTDLLLFRAESTSFMESRFRNVLLQGAQFMGSVWFQSAVFEGKARFIQARFSSNYSFYNVEFKNIASFSAASFTDYGDFHHTTFGKRVYFEKSSFDRYAMFDSAVFEGTASFEGAKFSAPEVRFKNCHFRMPCVFEKAAFSSYPDFSGAILHERTSFTADNELWPTGKPDTDHIWESRASCAVIRHNLGKQGLPEAEHFFYRREMEFSGHIGGFLQRLPYRLFGVLSDYGHSIEGPCFGYWGSGYLPE